MNKSLRLSITLFLGLAGCAEQFPPVYVTDDNGYVHKTMHYLQDTRGQKYFPLQAPATGRKEFIFDPRAYAWAAYDATGNRVMTGSASGGQDFCQDVNEECRTVVGSFHIYNKRGAECLSGEYPVDTKGGAKMPYCMYFFRGFTIHAAFEVPYANSSHGCIRVLPSAAQWLNENFITRGTGVTVLPYSEKKLH